MRSGPGLFIAALAWLLLGVGGFFSEPLSLIWFLSGIFLLPFIIIDALILRFFSDRLIVSREIASTLAMGIPAAVKLRIKKTGSGFLPFKILLFDLYPETMKTSAFPAMLNRGMLKKNDEMIFEYTLVPLERGLWEFSGTELLSVSLLRFWRLKISHQCLSRGRTYPDFNKLKEAAGADMRGILERSGVKNIRRRGQGLEFQSLRDYQEGDSVRNIDWRATSRRQKVIIREYQEEQDQQVLLLLDSGYRLHRREGEYMQFDSALGAVLILSYAALKHGDAVAVGSFGSSDRWIPPRKGIGAFPGLMNGLYDLQSAPVPSSPFSALEEALARLHRRTFIILVSNFREEDGESLSWILKRIEKRHLLLLVSLRELEAEQLAVRRPATGDEALETAAAYSYIATRRRLYQSWEHSGLLTLEAPAARLSSDLINRYLQVKRSGRL
ncbi:hypothetical protein AGMMS49928_16920 [Spirochaetia bacterium]|nr:hypothetical protein AGMMS49928_16920 [Spirochaetia bacterium]